MNPNKSLYRENDYFYEETEEIEWKPTYIVGDVSPTYTPERIEQDNINRVKQARLYKAQYKECTECGINSLHDPDDFICIKCRDGDAALPDPEWLDRNPF